MRKETTCVMSEWDDISIVDIFYVTYEELTVKAF